MATKNVAVFGIYETVGLAERAGDRLSRAGFPQNDISVLFPDSQSTKEFAQSISIWYLAAWWRVLEKGTCSGRVFKTAGTAHPPPAPLFVSRTGAQMVGAIRTSTRCWQH